MNDRQLAQGSGGVLSACSRSRISRNPLEVSTHQGFVVPGQRQHGTWKPGLAGPLAGLFLAVYGAGVLALRTYALPMSRDYAAYVIVTSMLFRVRMSDEALARPVFGLATRYRDRRLERLRLPARAHRRCSS